MQTVKIITDDGNERIIPVIGEVNVYPQGSSGFDEIVSSAVAHGGDVTDCRAVICYNCCDHSSVGYLYEEDRAYIMNGNGKTVASI